MYEKDSDKCLDALVRMGVLVPGGDRTAVKRTADFFLNQFTERLEAQVCAHMCAYVCVCVCVHVGGGWRGAGCACLYDGCGLWLRRGHECWPALCCRRPTAAAVFRERRAFVWGAFSDIDRLPCVCSAARLPTLQKRERKANRNYGKSFKPQASKEDKQAKRKQILASIGEASCPLPAVYGCTHVLPAAARARASKGN